MLVVICKIYHKRRRVYSMFPIAIIIIIYLDFTATPKYIIHVYQRFICDNSFYMTLIMYIVLIFARSLDFCLQYVESGLYR